MHAMRPSRMIAAKRAGGAISPPPTLAWGGEHARRDHVFTAGLRVGTPHA
jgi:hypothetical protein